MAKKSHALRSRRRRGLLGVGLLLVLGASTFVWGALTVRNEVFPYRLLRGIALRQDLVEHEPSLRELVEPRSEAMASLESLPYAAASYDPLADRRGVVVHDPHRAFDGYNLYLHRGRRQAMLLDMDGEVVHRWRFEVDPGISEIHLELDPRTGDLLLGLAESAIVKLDRDSNELWRHPVRAHHDLSVARDGEIYALTRENRRIREIHADVDVLEDFVTVLTPDGQFLRRLSILELLRKSPYAFTLPSVAHLDRPDERSPDYEGALDIVHTNHVEVLDGRLADRAPLYSEGNLLLSMRHLNAAMIVDPVAEEIVWFWGPTNLQMPHHPTVLENGNILLFDNGREASRVLEIDPLERKIEWIYAPGEDFFSRTRGSNQRLPNGNTLITESDPGYVYEVTPEGEVVWEFANPEVDAKSYRQSLWRMVRFAPEDLEFLDASLEHSRDERSG